MPHHHRSIQHTDSDIFGTQKQKHYFYVWMFVLTRGLRSVSSSVCGSRKTKWIFQMNFNKTFNFRNARESKWNFSQLKWKFFALSLYYIVHFVISPYSYHSPTLTQNERLTHTMVLPPTNIAIPHQKCEKAAHSGAVSGVIIVALTPFHFIYFLFRLSLQLSHA